MQNFAPSGFSGAQRTQTCMRQRLHQRWSPASMAFTTRREPRGTFGMVASTHWLASAMGMSVLERGGNAFDAACATGFTLQVVEPHLNGPGGEVPAVFWSESHGRPLALCGQGVAPAAATIERFGELGHDLIPGTGGLAASSRAPSAAGCCCCAALEYLAPRGRPRAGDGVRGARLPAPRADPRDDRAHRRAASRRGPGRATSTCPRLPPASCSGTRRSGRPGAGSSGDRARFRARRRSSARGRHGTKAPSPRRSTASPPPRAGC